jgi:hypothetical protein
VAAFTHPQSSLSWGRASRPFLSLSLKKKDLIAQPVPSISGPGAAVHHFLFLALPISAFLSKSRKQKKKKTMERKEA